MRGPLFIRAFLHALRIGSSGRFAAGLLSLSLVVQACSAPATGPDAAKQLLERAADRMGGWRVIDAIETEIIRTRGNDWEPLQAVSPGGDPRRVASFEQTLSVDYKSPRLRLDFAAQRLYPTETRIEFSEVIDGDVGLLLPANERLHPSRLATRLRDYNRLPLRLLYVAKAAPDLTRVEDRTVEGATVQVLTYTDTGLPVELHIDPATELPRRVIYKEDDPVYGDTLNEVKFEDWRYQAGIQIPRTLTTSLNGKKIRDERVVGLIENRSVDPSRFSVPADVRAQPEIGERVVSQWTLRRADMGVSYLDFARAQHVEFVDVAPGVFQLRGASHHSMVVEMADHLIVIEAPLFEERSVAVLQALEKRFPGKPVRYLVVTHFHFDHTGGIRAYAAKNATLLVPESIVAFVEETLKRPHTIRPDSLARQLSSNLKVEGVSEVKTLSDGARTVELRPVPNDHASGMLVAYLPKEQVVFVSDLYSPVGATPNPSVIFERERAKAFYEYLRDAHLAVKTIVGGHGAVGPLGDLQKAIAE